MATSGRHPKGDRVSLSLLSSAHRGQPKRSGEFEAPTVEHSFFFDRIGDGTVIASVKAMVLLVLGTMLIMAFFLAAVPQGAHDAGQAAVRRRIASTDSSATASPSRSSVASTAASGPAS